MDEVLRSGFRSVVGLDVSLSANIKLFNVLMPLDQVAFDLNPKSFKVSKGQWAQMRPSAGGAQSGAAPAPTAARSGYRSLPLGTYPSKVDFTALLSDESTSTGDAILDASALGGGIKARCDLLFSWTQPGGGSLAGKVASAAASLAGFRVNAPVNYPLLTLQWGDPARGFLMQGRLQAVTVRYVRFDPLGNPIRAEVDCTFEEAENALLNLLTNPTSGGVPGWRGHVLTQGETLPGLAVTHYGRPEAWRDIAEANGIDDPLRVRPGLRLALPPAGAPRERKT